MSTPLLPSDLSARVKTCCAEHGFDLSLTLDAAAGEAAGFRETLVDLIAGEWLPPESCWTHDEIPPPAPRAATGT